MNYLESTAIFSPCQRYRYQLTRKWGTDFGCADMAMVIGLNPSTADANQDDPTVRRCVGFAKSLGCLGLFMTNVFAFRSTDPKGLRLVADPIGEANDHWLLETAKKASLVIAAWGVHGAYKARSFEVKRLLNNMKCFGVTKEGHPRHPLYLAKATTLVDFN